DSISNSGAIVGSGISGIVVSAGSTVSGAITNNVTGTISGANFGIGLAGAVQSGVANAGSITGLSEDGILVYGASASVTGGIVNVANASILGEDSGILIALGATVDTIGNSGSVVGTTEAGIALISAGTVTGALTNTLGGTITGESAGILVDDVSVIGSGIINAGVITATDTAGTGIKITTNSSVGSVTNSGTIAGGANGLAVQFGNSASTLTLQTGSHLTGDADGGAGTNDTLVLEGNGVEDADFTNFESLTVSASASGTWVLSGDSNFTDLTLNSGTLDIQGTIGTTLTPLATVNLAGGELSVSNGGVLNVAAISAPSGDLDIETGTINVTSSITVGGSLNVGTMGALSAASLNVTGDADISGAVDVTGGALVVGGALNVASTGALTADTVSATDVDVEGLLTTTNGVTVSGILSGSGTIAGGLVTVNGTLSPGNSPGQIDVASIALGSGSVYLVEHEVGATPVETDITVATGTVTIGTDVDVNVSVGAGSDGFEDDILTAAGGIIGTFDEITGLDGNAVGLIVYDDLITPTIATLVVAKTDALVATVGTVSDAGFVFLDNLQEGARRDGRVWASAYIYNAENEGQGTSGADYDQDAFGFNAGVDVISEPDLKVGVALGYLDGDVDINSATSEAENDAIFGAAYLNYMNDNFYLDGAVMIGQQTVDTTRTLTGGDATASVDATSYGANLEAGLELEALGGRLSPFVKVGIHSASLDAYSEAGAAGIGAMTVGEVETQQMRLGGGFRYAVDLGSEDGIQVTPTLKVGMTQEWQNTDSSADIGFVGYTGSTTASLDFEDQTTVDLGLSFDVKLSEAITAFVGWDAALGDETTRNTGTIG
ncbi:MAG: autotransporter domain-containing protein, partial [Gammaproteobacteria bacterium]|nr:autotransporter domain-containing protein [Gammaproteobacteria bacterium]